MIRTNEFYPEGWKYDTAENKRAVFSPTTLAEAQKNGDILEAPVIMCDADHNLILDLGCMRGIIKREEGAIGISEGTTKDIALITKVGKPVCFIVKSIKTDRFGKLYAELSRKEAQNRFLNYFLRYKTVGDIIAARVTHLERFGAFCDIGCGIISLLPIDAISVSRISHPGDRFAIGDDLKVIIKSIDSKNRITLSHKELLGTWEENAAMFSDGQTVSGIVRSVESYGIFIELAPNLAGLAEVKDGILPGMCAGVFIKSIIPEKMKVKLIIIDAFSGEYTYPLKYFYEKEHIDFWEYSPKNSAKQIFTDFSHQ